MSSEFDHFAAAGYSKLLHHPIREKFAPGSRFFFERKLLLLRAFYQRRGENTKLATWLDVGCGEGTLLNLGKPYFREVVGCDISAGMIQNCQGLEVRRQESCDRIPFDSGSFDLVTTVCVYHHVDAAERGPLTSEIWRVLKPGGIFCIIEHNPLNLVTQLIVRSTPLDKRARLLSAAEAKRLIRFAEMRVLETQYFLLLPERIYRKMASFETRLSAIPLGGQYAVFGQKA
jgi:SAM-dependent methyltransferase